MELLTGHTRQLLPGLGEFSMVFVDVWGTQYSEILSLAAAAKRRRAGGGQRAAQRGGGVLVARGAGSGCAGLPHEAAAGAGGAARGGEGFWALKGLFKTLSEPVFCLFLHGFAWFWVPLGAFGCRTGCL